MSMVIVERTFRERVSGEQVLAVDQRNRWCFQAHAIQPKGHLISKDGLRLCCVIDAPDAESVRIASRKANMSLADRVWSATAHGPVAEMDELSRRADGADRALVVVERSFPEPVRFDDVQSIEDRGAWCLSLNRVEFLASYLAFDGQRMICLYEAPDAQSVSRTNARLGLPFDRAWSAELHLCQEPAGKLSTG
ncbi:MAG TPA: nickel-binding protein [Azospirillum sp.]|nr:nickel-binding protein [Azospirillum sp.]